MIDKVVFKHPLTEDTVDRELAYWATRSPEERWNAVQKLREQFYGRNDTVERVITIRKLPRFSEETHSPELFQPHSR